MVGVNKYLYSFVSVAFFAFSANSTLWADEIPTDWQGIRSTGMGDAFTAVGNDETAPFTNPAGLSRTRNPRAKAYVHKVTFPGLVVGGNKLAISGVNKDKTKPIQLIPKLAASVKANNKKTGFIEGQMYPSIIFGNRSSATFLLGFPSRTTAAMQQKDTEDADTINVRAQTTVGAVLGIASMSRGGTIGYGLSVRPNVRYSYEGNLASESVTLQGLKTEERTNGVRSTAVAGDVGMLITAGDFWLPTLGLSVRNIPTGCVEKYVNPVTGDLQTVCGVLRSGAPVGSSSDALLDPTEVRIGVAITPRFNLGGTRANLRISADAWPLPVVIKSKSYGITNINVNRLLHAGAELYFGNAFLQNGIGFRAGSNQGQLCYGATLKLFGIALEYSFYGVDTGTSKVAKIESRHLIGITGDW